MTRTRLTLDRFRTALIRVTMAALAVGAGTALAFTVPAGGASGAAGWSVTGVALPPNAVSSGLSDAFSSSCPAPGNCVVVGVYETTASSSAVYVDTQAAGSWTAAEVPLPPGTVGNADPVPQSVACPQVGSCTVVGGYTQGAAHDDFAATLSSGSWTSQQLPVPPDPAATPDVIPTATSCPAPGSCAVVGTYHASPGTKKVGFLLTEAGSTWTDVQAPVPSNAAATPDVTLTSVDCWAAGGCVAAGGYHTSTSATGGMLETLNGGSWTVAPTPLPPGGTLSTSFGLSSVSCPAPGDCTASGAFTTGAGHIAGLVVTDNGGVLGASAPPVPANATTGADSGSLLYTVSCPTTTWCVVGGIYADGGSPTGTIYFAELTGGTWKATQAPGLPTNATAIVTSMSCSWPGSCSASGITVSGTHPTGFLETLVNGTWAGQTAVVPPGSAPGSFFGSPDALSNAISCVAGTCAAAGTSGFTTTGGERGFIDTFPGLDGYQEVASDGGLFAFGTPFFGSMGGMPLNEPIVGMAVKPDNGGYYEVASDGGIFAFGATFHGSMGGKPLNEPIVGIAFDTLTGGYYEVASDGGIFAFTAPFHGSMGGKPLNAPIVGIAFDPDTGGYYEVASDGGIFAFTAPFHGSMGGKPLNKPIVGITVDTATGGYYEVASDGGLFAFTAPFHGSMGGMPLNEPIVGMAYDYVTGGYYEVASDGGLFAFTAPFNGSMGGKPLNKPVVGIAFG